VHLARKVFHFSTGYMIALGYHLLLPERSHFAILMSAAAAFVLSIEVLRLQSSSLNKLVQTVFRPFMRAHETRKFTGMAYYISGVAVASLLSEKRAACVGILMLASADPVASLAGVLTRSHTWARLAHGKSLIGFFFAFLIALLVILRIALVSTSPFSISSALFLQRASLVALAAAVAEFAVPSPQITLRARKFPLGLDDNFVVPVVAALAAQFVLGPAGLSALRFSKFLLW